MNLNIMEGREVDVMTIKNYMLLVCYFQPNICFMSYVINRSNYKRKSDS